jgi:malonyl-CoA/methylmalonyl-CoA synthetase
MPNPLYDALILPHRGGARTFLDLDGKGRLTFGDFADLVARISTVLLAQGVKPGDRVAVQAPKTPETLAVYLACQQVGAVFLPLNTAYTPSEIEFFLTDAHPRLFVCDEASKDAYSELAKRLGIALMTIAADRAGSLPEAVSKAQPMTEIVTRGPDDLAAILYTSGTTGRSKGAMLSHDNLLSNTLALVDIWRFSGDDVLVHALPIYHTHGLFVACNIMLKVGGTMIFHAAFNPDAVLDAIPRATALMGVPTFYTRLLACPRLTKEHVANMRLFVSGSAPLLAETHVEFEQRTGHRILERYGMTETSMTTSNPYDGERRAGAVGFPLPGVSVRVASPDGKILPQGEIGILEVKGPNVFKGYWNLPEKTAAEFRPGGWFITGDMSMIDDDGYVHIVGRQKDLIIAGGLNIYPKEIEEVIDTIHGVIETAIVGVPHPDMGEAVVAVIAAKPDLDLETVKATVGEKLARFKHPRRYEIVAELPRNTMGKVQKAQLREMYKDSFSG